VSSKHRLRARQFRIVYHVEKFQMPDHRKLACRFGRNFPTELRTLKPVIDLKDQRNATVLVRVRAVVLWSGIWKRFHMFTADNPQLARSPTVGNLLRGRPTSDHENPEF
jgi:hypothetical protein